MRELNLHLRNVAKNKFKKKVKYINKKFLKRHNNEFILFKENIGKTYLGH